MDDCADAYAQTIAYGLFLAKINDETELDRQTAAYHIPTNVIVIRQIFSSISGIALPKNVSWIVDALIDILNASEIDKILADIDFRGKKDRDPFTFFYEDFLAFYEPEKKKRLGVYYTPRPVVSFIVNSVNQILKDTFGKLRGFAEDDLVVLDPAVGTGTFLWLVFLLTLRELKNLGGLTKTKIKDHILKDFYGFELLITSYVIAHLKLTTILNRWHYEFDQQDRVQVYLTNTLNPSEMHGYSPFLRELNEESMIADFVKREKPVLVIVGNPPYSASSSNKSDWIMEKLQDYKKDLNERNIRQLDDDYVKFVRFAQWKIEQNGQGIVGFITNNSYLDGVIHKQMRKHLLQTFDRIYILNLHGDSRKKEKAPDGSKDENVFDIQQGVAIGLFVKNNRFQDKKVLYADLFGTREEKYRWLDRNTLKTIKWQDLNYSDHPDNFFVPKDFALKEEYCKFKALDEIFQDHNVGVQTHRDDFVISFTEPELKTKMDLFRSNQSDEYVIARLNLKETKGWQVNKVRATFRKVDYSKYVREYAFRPFDKRFICYFPPLMDRPREGLMKNFYEPNVGLISVRQFAETALFSHAFVTETITNDRMSLSNRGAGIVFPLYVYDDEAKVQQASLDEANTGNKKLVAKRPNFTSEFSQFIKQQYPDHEISPEEVMAYIYAMLYSPSYRESYNEFLKVGFPRINFVKDSSMFKNLSEIGRELINLHLTKIELETSTAFDIEGTNLVKSVKFKDGRAFINETQFFGGIPEEVWKFCIGGYLVLDKWLKSRKGRELSSSEIEHFLQIVEVIKKTIEYMKEIDGLAYFSPT